MERPKFCGTCGKSQNPFSVATEVSRPMARRAPEPVYEEEDDLDVDVESLADALSFSAAGEGGVKLKSGPRSASRDVMKELICD